ncbi:hypothetical protein ACMXYV_12540 [Neptuniibacter sp. SY11_33]|uniref:hypothetical protein n=1 Tax=Neptuniibacter sp. SY11_33 TaxID=3398215 RepID=UPI0039F5C141
MRIDKRLLLLPLCLFALAGCVTQQSKPSSEGMYKPHPWVDTAKIWRHPQVTEEQIAGYSQIEVVGVEVDRTGQFVGVTAADIAKVQSVFPKLLNQKLNYNQTPNSSGKSVFNAGEKLNVKVMLLDAQRLEPGMTARDFIPIRLIYKAGKEAYNGIAGNEETIFVAGIRLDLYDGASDQMLLSIEDRLEGDVETWSGNKRDFHDIDELLQMWADRFQGNLLKLRKRANMIEERS